MQIARTIGAIGYYLLPKKRIVVYHTETKPLVGYYVNLAKSGSARAPGYAAIAGLGKVDDVRDQIFRALDSCQK